MYLVVAFDAFAVVDERLVAAPHVLLCRVAVVQVRQCRVQLVGQLLDLC